MDNETIIRLLKFFLDTMILEKNFSLSELDYFHWNNYDESLEVWLTQISQRWEAHELQICPLRIVWDGLEEIFARRDLKNFTFDVKTSKLTFEE